MLTGLPSGLRSGCDLCRRWFIAIFLVAPALLVGAYAESDPAIVEFVGQVSRSAQAIAVEPNQGRAYAMCLDLLRAVVDLDAMASVASAGAWDRMNPRQQGRYRSAFERRLARDCLFRSGEYGGGALSLVGVRGGERGDRLVATRVEASGEAGRNVIWRLRSEAGGRLRAVDILLDGRSILIAMRDAAKNALDRGSGDVEALIRSLGQ